MKRVTQGGDISFNVADVKGLGDNYAFRFYTTDSCKYIVKVDGDAVDDIIRLEWDELKTLGDGVLCYYADNLEPDEEYSDATFNRTFGGTTQWYIVTSCGGSGSSEEISGLSDKLDTEIERSKAVDNRLSDSIAENIVEIQRLGDRLYGETYTKEEVDQKIAEAEIGGDLPSDVVVDPNYVHTDNNFTTTLKNKLDGIATGAEINVQADWNITDTSSDAYIQHKPTIPKNTSDLTNDSNFVVDANYVHTDNNYTNADSAAVATIPSKANDADVVKSISVNGDTQTKDAQGNVNISVEGGSVESVTVNGTKHTPDPNGDVNLGTIQGEKGDKGDTGNVEITDAGDMVALIVNDLTTGGAGNFLSAEMGKRLKQNVDAVQANIVKLYSKLANMAFWDADDKADAAPTALDWSVPKVVVTITNSIGAGAIIKRNGVVVNGNFQVDQGDPLTLTIEAADDYTLSNVAATVDGTAATLTEIDGVYTLEIAHVDATMSIVVSGTVETAWIEVPYNDVIENGQVVQYGMQQGRSVNAPTGTTANGAAEANNPSTPLVLMMPAGYDERQNPYLINSNGNPGKIAANYFPTDGKRYLEVLLENVSDLDTHEYSMAVGCYTNAIINNQKADLPSYNTVMDGWVGRINYATPNNGELKWKIDLHQYATSNNKAAGDIAYIKLLFTRRVKGATAADDTRTWASNIKIKYFIGDD